MRTFWFVITTAVGLVVANANAQTYPDLSGKWTLIADRSEPDGQSAFGETFTAAQDAKAIIVTWQMLVQGRGTGPQKHPLTVRSTYRLDGAETNPDIVNGTAFRFDTASWSEGKLTVLRTERLPSRPLHPVKKTVIWLEPDGTLVVETTLGQAVASAPVRNYYKKVS
jgi:hypothetical protein